MKINLLTIMILTIVVSLTLGVFTACEDMGKPKPIPQAPGAYIPLGNVGTVTSGTWNGTSVSYLYMGNRTSAQEAVRISDETGSGLIVYNASPTLATPTITGNTSMYAITSGTWNGTSIGYLYEQTRTSAQQAVVLSDETGTGLVVFGTSPTITTPTITTPTITGSTSMYAVTSGTWNGTSISYLYEGNRTSAQQALVLSDETGTGSIVFGTSPTIASPAITSPTITGNTSMYAITSGTWNASSIGFSYLQMSRGNTVILAGNTTAAVTHNLGTTPTVVIATWNALAPTPVVASAATLWTSVIGATTFQINIDNALSNAPTIAWIALP